MTNEEFNPTEPVYLVKKTELLDLLAAAHQLCILSGPAAASVSNEDYHREKRGYIHDLLDCTSISEAMTPDEYEKYCEEADVETLAEIELADFPEWRERCGVECQFSFKQREE